MLLIFAEEKGLQVDQSGQNRPSVFTGDQQFESPLLRQRVRLSKSISRPPARFGPFLVRFSSISLQSEPQMGHDAALSRRNLGNVG
jgi:hypothetical protein